MSAVQGFFIWWVTWAYCNMEISSVSVYKEDYRELLKLSDQHLSNEFTDLGCYNEDFKYNPNDYHYQYVINTPRLCSEQCWRYKIQYANCAHMKCFCTDKPHTNRTTADKCNFIAPIFRTEFCGSVSKRFISVSNTGYVAIKWGIVDYMYRRIQSTKARRKQDRDIAITFPDRSHECVDWIPGSTYNVSSLFMTPQICVVLCFHYKFIYALLNKGKTCLCSSQSPPLFTVDACKLNCTGDDQVMCGGRGAMSTIFNTGHYKADDFESKENYIEMKGLNRNMTGYYKEHPEIDRNFKFFMTPKAKTPKANDFSKKDYEYLVGSEYYQEIKANGAVLEDNGAVANLINRVLGANISKETLYLGSLIGGTALLSFTVLGLLIAIIIIKSRQAEAEQKRKAMKKRKKKKKAKAGR